MKVIRQNVRPASVILIILVLSLTINYQTVLAAMVGTEAVIDFVRGKQARDKINNLLLREDVQTLLKAQRIDPLEAKARIDSLSDAEVTRIADHIDKLPAGGASYASSVSAYILPAIPVYAGAVVTDQSPDNFYWASTNWDFRDCGEEFGIRLATSIYWNRYLYYMILPPF